MVYQGLGLGQDSSELRRGHAIETHRDPAQEEVGLLPLDIGEQRMSDRGVNESILWKSQLLEVP